MCVFCEIVAGRSPARFVHRTGAASAFLPRAGWLRRGHTLIVPDAHATGAQDVSLDDLAATMELVQRVSHAMRSVLGATGVNILNASGPGSGQSVDHLHFHVVPIRPGDDVDFWPKVDSVASDATIDSELAAWFAQSR